MRVIAPLVALTCLAGVSADTYMHNPRGANDRNCERNENRNNGNRLWDSQNNAKGGYACPRAVGGPAVLTPKLYYTAGSIVPIEWTSQHGCGGNTKTNCEVVIQYACENSLDPSHIFRSNNAGEANRVAYGVSVPSDTAGKNTAASLTATTGEELMYIDKLHIVGTPRDGVPRDADDAATDTIPITANGKEAYIGDVENRRYGMHETYDYYQGGVDATGAQAPAVGDATARKRTIGCTERQRNKGLFIADQKVNGNSARFSRQNPNGNRNGLECPEESEYYPYWHPTPWKDIAVLTDEGDTQQSTNSLRCQYYKSESQNVKDKYQCEYDETATKRLDYVIAFNTVGATPTADAAAADFICLRDNGANPTTGTQVKDNTCNTGDNNQKYRFQSGTVIEDASLTGHIRRQTASNDVFYCLDFDITQNAGVPPYDLMTRKCDATAMTQKWTWDASATKSGWIKSNWQYDQTGENGVITKKDLCIDTGYTGTATKPVSGTQARVTFCNTDSTQQSWFQIQLPVDQTQISSLRAQGNFPNQRVSCMVAGQKWTKTEKFDLPAPDCLKPQLSRVNQLGNAADETLTYSIQAKDKNIPQAVNANRYLWTVPNDIDENCVLRLRYNISTTDYPAWEDVSGDVGINADGSCKSGGCAFSKPGVDWKLNGDDLSPVQQDPYVQVGPDANTDFVSMAINTNQYGRTFQDRSYVFAIRPKPSDVKGQVYNLNVRGKRGNIVQTYPAVEYDFAPNALEIASGDYIHFQWTGSDYNPRRGPNDAEGGPPDANTLDPNQANNNQRADRSNFVQMVWASNNMPAEQDYTPATYGGDGSPASTAGVPNTKTSNGKWGAPTDVQSVFANSNGVCDDACQEATRRMVMLDQVAWLTKREDAAAADRRCLTLTELNNIGNEANRENHPRNCAKLNAQFTPYFNGGLVQMRNKGAFAYFSSRNNNFSNRDQSGMICVSSTGNCQDGSVTSNAAAFKSVASIANEENTGAGLAAGMFFLGGFIIWAVHFGYAKHAARSGKSQLYTNGAAQTTSSSSML